MLSATQSQRYSTWTLLSLSATQHKLFSAKAFLCLSRAVSASLLSSVMQAPLPRPAQRPLESASLTTAERFINSRGTASQIEKYEYWPVFLFVKPDIQHNVPLLDFVMILK